MSKNKKGRGPTPMSEPPGQDWNYYVNFVLYAVGGLMAQADELMRRHKSSIHRVAKYLTGRRRPRFQTVFRGVILAPSEVGPDRKLHMQGDYAGLTFVSFTEDKDVACWFADPRSSMALLIAQQKGPGATGYLIEATPREDDLLFHHSWAERFPMPAPAGQRHLAEFAAMHPDLRHIAHDLVRSLRTQREVILKPSRAGYDLRPTSDCPPTDRLDARFWPGGPPPGAPLHNPDPERRDLERRAAEGDVQAQAKLDRLLLRLGEREARRPYMVDLVEPLRPTHGLYKPEDMEDYQRALAGAPCRWCKGATEAGCPGCQGTGRLQAREPWRWIPKETYAAGIRAVLKKAKIGPKQISVTTPSYSGASSVELRGPSAVIDGPFGKGKGHTPLARDVVLKVADIFGITHVPGGPIGPEHPHPTDLSLHPTHRQDRSDQLSDYWHEEGPRLLEDYHEVFLKAVRDDLARQQKRLNEKHAKRGGKPRRNPDDDFRKLERAAASGDVSDRARHLAALRRSGQITPWDDAFLRQQEGQHVDPWELNPVSHTFVAAYLAGHPDESPSRGQAPTARVEATTAAGDVERFYVASHGYPFHMNGIIGLQREYTLNNMRSRPVADLIQFNQRLHMSQVHLARAAGMIVIHGRFPPGHGAEHEGTGCFCWAQQFVVLGAANRFNENRTSTLRTLIPSRYSSARIMEKRGTSWKNNPDDRTRQLARRVAAGDVEAASALITAAMRQGGYFVPWDEHHLNPRWTNSWRAWWIRLLLHLRWGRAAEIAALAPSVVPPFSDGSPVRLAVPLTSFRTIGPEVAVGIGVELMGWLAYAATRAVLPMVVGDDKALATAVDQELQDWTRLHTIMPGHAVDTDLAGEAETLRKGLWHNAVARDPRRGRVRGSVVAAANEYAMKALRGLLETPSYHYSDRPAHFGGVIFNATQALAWSCEHRHDPERQLAGDVGISARHLERIRGHAGFDTPGLRCSREANEKIRRVLLPEALLAIARNLSNTLP